ncbi:MAG: hypothetical protein ABIS68_00290 [Casimicrobiaceae bacterium]
MSPIRAAAVFVIAALCCSGSLRAAQEVHGTSDAFAGNGVAIAWGVLRGASEETTIIALRIAVVPGRYARIAADGIDPFTKQRSLRLAMRALSSVTDVRTARKGFADFPRTELRFFAPGSMAAAEPDLIVYYLGVPDTTPEFASDSALDAYLSDRITRLQSTGAGKP